MQEAFNHNLINILIYSIEKVQIDKGAYYEKENRY